MHSPGHEVLCGLGDLRPGVDVQIQGLIQHPLEYLPIRAAPKWLQHMCTAASNADATVQGAASA